MQEVINEDDELLKGLKAEWGLLDLSQVMLLLIFTSVTENACSSRDERWRMHNEGRPLQLTNTIIAESTRIQQLPHFLSSPAVTGEEDVAGNKQQVKAQIQSSEDSTNLSASLVHTDYAASNMNKAGSKLSKLDRFLLSEDVITACPDLKATVLDRLWSDHNPILLHVDKTDFGPIPFKLYNSWMQREGFNTMIKTINEEYFNQNLGLQSSLKQNLKIFKSKIKAIHGSEAGFDGKSCATSGIWSSIVGTTNYLHSHNLLPKDTLKCHLGSGSSIRFCKDLWLGDEPLCSRYNRLFRLDINENCLICDRYIEGNWSWQWQRPVSGRTETLM
ncbi:RNA-directed DNA polymerase, eukaryota [Artemisia annua]|uniref:RNA-directed DNA polymerase, eukaryota n=1 Tax=Artemisia annua TaxID=35608 RepID=A0A2U1N4F5_ARTAN|nr:RNA-directed DNA polymerase, eukaryota [Artemisia annua]